MSDSLIDRVHAASRRRKFDTRAFARLGRRFPVDELEDLRLLGAPQLRRLLERLGAHRARVVKNRVGGLPMALSVVLRSR